MKALVTGGAGFIGSCLVKHLFDASDAELLIVDALTYAGRKQNLDGLLGEERVSFAHENICNKDAVASLINSYHPDVIFHLAAESHVDRSIDSASEFVETNVMGTQILLDAARHYWMGMGEAQKASFRFVHISTDEVYGALGPVGEFDEDAPYAPNSPYAASKAASDFLVRASYKTFGLPVVISNCSNNYGPRQYPEKLIPLITLNALHGQELPVYGDGMQIRDWLHVEDHARALWCLATKGQPGETYCIGGSEEHANIEIVHTVCDVFDGMFPDAPWGAHRDLIVHVDDRLGHDVRYAINSSKIQSQLGWKPEVDFKEGLRKTVEWYLGNREWWGTLREGDDARSRRGTTK